MKKFYSILVILIMAQTAIGQVVLNEIYPEPGAGRHEFFELYNTDISSAGMSVDGISIVTYFEIGATKGFYVLDLPDLTIAPKGFFVGAAEIPFGYQSNANSTSADFSWNDPALIANYGSITKWVQANDNDASDGNLNYNQASIPANFNDLFVKLVGGGAAYNAFIFKNGVLVNGFLGNQSSVYIPNVIANMPELNVQLAINNNAPVSFPVNWNALQTRPMERVIASIGSDNGYVRLKDGMCGTWEKSSSSVQHTPRAPNGSATATSGDVNITATITRGGATETTSTLTYSLAAAQGDIFPLQIHFYLDNGPVNNELDAGDIYYETQTIESFSSNQYTSIFTPKDANILMVVKTVSGCFDHVKYVANIQHVVLPVQVKSFNIAARKGQAMLDWVVSGNEWIDQIIVEKDRGNGFQQTGLVLPTEQAGEVTYYFPINQDDYNYRLKIVTRSGQVIYSKVIYLNVNKAGMSRVVGNPTNGAFKIQFGLQQHQEQVLVNVIDQNGKKLITAAHFAVPGQQVELHQTKNLPPGLYYIEIITKLNTAQLLKIVKG